MQSVVSSVLREGRAVQRIHVAIIMDGNGRWATRRGMPRQAGHAAGVEALGHILEAAPDVGIGTLTVYAFSTDNWQRPTAEVNALMGLLRRYVEKETRRLVEGGARLTVIGRRDRLPADVAAAIGRAERATARGTKLHLRVAVDYSARDAILAAAETTARSGEFTREAFLRTLTSDAAGEPANHRYVDLLVRTGGEKRLSDFLLWECAYAELYFTDRLWPDFSAEDLATAVAAFHARERRFGGLGPSVSAA
ncbi:MAG: di-trans,poly-cis-decaprenylcistransferase [Hyphomicrobiaceae bacterium]|nr:di-trans,poly-cis-decaprenylcistransferase [Hyphomicrobiaceae bacterium]